MISNVLSVNLSHHLLMNFVWLLQVIKSVFIHSFPVFIFQEELSQLVENRNDARQHAFQAMKEFLEVSEQLPIDDRLTTLEVYFCEYHHLKVHSFSK